MQLKLRLSLTLALSRWARVVPFQHWSASPFSERPCHGAGASLSRCRNDSVQFKPTPHSACAVSGQTRSVTGQIVHSAQPIPLVLQDLSAVPVAACKKTLASPESTRPDPPSAIFTLAAAYDKSRPRILHPEFPPHGASIGLTLRLQSISTTWPPPNYCQLSGPLYVRRHPVPGATHDVRITFVDSNCSNN